MADEATIERIISVLSYDSDSGNLTWVKTLSNRAPAGSLAGSYTNRYREVSVDDVRYRATAVIWAIVHGRFPDNFIDHKDGNPSNDRLSNLREATPSQNSHNTKMHADNRSGFKGITRDRLNNRNKEWVARIHINGKRKNLGYFLTKEEAYAAYVKAAGEYFGEFARIA